MNLYVNVLYTSQQPRQVKIGVSVNQAANVRELREILASDTGVNENHMLLTEIHDEGFHRLNCDLKNQKRILHSIAMKGKQLIALRINFIAKENTENVKVRRYNLATFFLLFYNFQSVCIVY